MKGNSDRYAPDAEAPPRNEREYLAYRIKELERADRRWKVWILATLVAVFLFFLLAAGLISFRGESSSNEGPASRRRGALASRAGTAAARCSEEEAGR
jgi:hypothetical protein